MKNWLKMLFSVILVNSSVCFAEIDQIVDIKPEETAALQGKPGMDAGLDILNVRDQEESRLRYILKREELQKKRIGLRNG